MSPPGPPRPRASATAGITKGTAHGIASATTVSAGRRSHRKVVPLFCTSLPPGSVRRAAATVGTVFRCVASRNRERVFYWGSLRLISNRACGQKSGSASLASHTPSGPNPLGENQSLSSPPLKPRGLLLSVMRQKVGKERSQGNCHPLGHPPLLPELSRNNSSKTPGGRGGFYPRARRGPTLSGRINLFPLPRSSRGGSYFL